MMPKSRRHDGPDFNTLIFLTLVAGLGVILLGYAGFAYARDGWDGRVNIRASWGLFITVAEAMALGAVLVGLSVLIVWKAKPFGAKRTETETRGDDNGLSRSR